MCGVDFSKKRGVELVLRSTTFLTTSKRAAAFHHFRCATQQTDARSAKIGIRRSDLAIFSVFGARSCPQFTLGATLVAKKGLEVGSK